MDFAGSKIRRRDRWRTLYASALGRPPFVSLRTLLRNRECRLLTNLTLLGRYDGPSRAIRGAHSFAVPIAFGRIKLPAAAHRVPGRRVFGCKQAAKQNTPDTTAEYDHGTEAGRLLCRATFAL